MASPEIVDLDAADAEALAERLLGLYYEARARMRRATAGLRLGTDAPA
jgi:hypothetical protein